MSGRTVGGTWLSWSSGKDSTMALRQLRADGVEVTGLLTTVNASADRVAMHAVRRELLVAQADRLGLALHVVELPWPCANDVYEAQMAAGVAAARDAGADAIAFGDLYLEDVRAYRERMLEGTGLTPRFPLWGRDTAELARAVVACGLRAVLTCVDPARLPASFAGRWFDDQLLAELPRDVDPCGEGGEFHTFVVDGPGFRAPLSVEVGQVLERDGFVFCDVVPT